MEGNISKIIKNTGDIFGFCIKIAEKFRYIPGQYIMIAFPDDVENKKAFSIVSYDPQSMEIFILIKKHGAFTQRMFESKLGQRISISGPYGRFTAKKEGKPLVFIAGGIGITPIYSMISHARENNHDEHIYLYYSAKNPEEMPFYDELKKINNSNIKIKYFFTAQDKTSKVKSTRIRCEQIEKDVLNFRDSIFYICGPLPMIEDFRIKLKEKGIRDDNIRSEEFT
jgi:NAD(P)H-flavin reductase